MLTLFEKEGKQQSRSLPASEWINCDISTMEYRLTVNINELRQHLIKWRDLKNTTVNEECKFQKSICSLTLVLLCSKTKIKQYIHYIQGGVVVGCTCVCQRERRKKQKNHQRNFPLVGHQEDGRRKRNRQT